MRFEIALMFEGSLASFAPVRFCIVYSILMRFQFRWGRKSVWTLLALEWLVFRVQALVFFLRSLARTRFRAVLAIESRFSVQG